MSQIQCSAGTGVQGTLTHIFQHPTVYVPTYNRDQALAMDAVYTLNLHSGLYGLVYCQAHKHAMQWFSVDPSVYE